MIEVRLDLSADEPRFDAVFRLLRDVEEGRGADGDRNAPEPDDGMLPS